MIDTLNGADTVTGSVAKSLKDAVGAWPAYTQATNSFDDSGSGIYQAVADKIDASIAQLNTDILDSVSTDFDTLSEIATKLGSLQGLIEVLNGADTVTGSVAKSLKDAIGAWPTYTPVSYTHLTLPTTPYV